MRVLHLPLNIASQLSITVRALRDIGVDARGLVFHNTAIQDRDGVDYIPFISMKSHPLRGAWRRVQIYRTFLKAVHWADVIHWHYGEPGLQGEFDLWYAHRLGKAGIVEFFGSDIRVPEIAARTNPYLARLSHGERLIPGESLERSRAVQARFARFGFACSSSHPEIDLYLQPEYFPQPYRNNIRLMLSEFQPRYPNPAKKRPLIVHAPSNQAVKGTPYVLAAIESLKGRFDFDFRLIHNMPRREALCLIAEADIMAEQFVIGMGIAVTGAEAMAFGKPTVAYVTPELRAKLPADYAVYPASPDELPDALARLLADGPLRLEYGRRGRAYVEKHHDAHTIARQFETIYSELIEKSHRKRKAAVAANG